jgi:hypothetical protein
LRLHDERCGGKTKFAAVGISVLMCTRKREGEGGAHGGGRRGEEVVAAVFVKKGEEGMEDEGAAMGKEKEKMGCFSSGGGVRKRGEEEAPS